MEQEIKTKKNTLRIIIIILAILIAAFAGVKYWLYSLKHETTDNAQLDATITSVRSDASGFVVSVRFVDNQFVKKGDTLAIIEQKDYQAKVLQAKAMLASAMAQTGVTKNIAAAATQNASASSFGSLASQSNIAAAKARLNKAQEDFNRIGKMFKDEAATQQQMDMVNAELQTAQAQYQVALSQYQASASQASGAKTSAGAQVEQIGVSNALVQQRQAELELAETQLKNTVIIAPFDGIVSKKSIEVGQLVQINQPVCSAVEIGDLWVVANFKETQLNDIKAGQTVSIKLDAYPDIKLTGTVESIGGATGAKFALLPSDNATGNFVKVTQRVPVRIKLNKTDTQGHVLTPGLSAFVDVEIK